MSKLFLSPHCDDETLFGAFIIQQEEPVVVVVLDGVVQQKKEGCEVKLYLEKRRSESRRAVDILLGDDRGGKNGVVFLGSPDDNPDWRNVESQFHVLKALYAPEIVYAPYPEVAVEDSHKQHDRVGQIARDVFSFCCQLRYYTTYTRKRGKSGPHYSAAKKVTPTPEQIKRKLSALREYDSQIAREDCREHFLRDLHEYIIEA